MGLFREVLADAENLRSFEVEVPRLLPPELADDSFNPLSDALSPERGGFSALLRGTSADPPRMPRLMEDNRDARRICCSYVPCKPRLLQLRLKAALHVNMSTTYRVRQVVLR